MVDQDRGAFGWAWRAVAVVGLVGAATALAVWAVHPRLVPVVNWNDHGTWLGYWMEAKGFDRHGWVDQARIRVWETPIGSALDPVRADHAAGRLGGLPPSSASWRPQFTDYGNNHVYLPGGTTLTEFGRVHVVPYHVMAAVLAAPAAARALLEWRRRRRDRRRAR